jgi:YegS/Rv2252/BmrU family lipid kinase
MPIPKKVLLIVNPVSGSRDKTELIELLHRRSEELRFEFEIYETTGACDREAVEQRMEAFQPDRVLVAGGDGTINQTANVIRSFKTSMGILPMGSANGLATSLGLPFEIDEAMEVALGAEIRSMDALMINDHLGLHMSDLGLNARLIKKYEEGQVRGKWGYLAKVAKTLSEHYTFTARIKTDETVIETEATMIILANASMYGTGVNVNPTGSMFDGRFEVIIATRFDLIELGKVLTGNTDFNPEIVRVLSTTSVNIECLVGEVLFQIDGEFQGVVHQVNAHVLPGVLTIAVLRK